MCFDCRHFCVFSAKDSIFVACRWLSSFSFLRYICLKLFHRRHISIFLSWRFWFVCADICLVDTKRLTELFQSSDRNSLWKLFSPFYISISTKSSAISFLHKLLNHAGFVFCLLCRHESAFTLMPQCDFIFLLTRHSTLTEIMPRHYSDFSAWLKEIWNDLLVGVENESSTKAIFSFSTIA